MKTEDKEMPLKRIIRLSSIIGGVGLLIFFFGGSYNFLGSVMVATALLLWVYRLFLRKMANNFQSNTVGKWERFYEKSLRNALHGRRPIWIVVGTIILLIGALMTFGV